MNDTASVVTQTLTVGRDANGVVQLSGSHNTVTVVISGDAQAPPATPSAVAGALGPNPYRSLLAFDETSHELFFGREALVAELLARLRNLLRRDGAGTGAPRLLGILGPSGSGKSSVARAGLIPAVAGSDDPRLRGARIAVLRPGPTPVRALAAVLARTLTGDPAPVLKTQEFEAAIRRAAASGAHDGLSLIASSLPEPQRPFLLLVDQFEETYTLTRPADARDAVAEARAKAERDALVGALWQAATAPHGNVVVALTLRMDFFGALSEHPAFGDALSRANVLVGPMLEDGLRDAIAKPAERRGYAMPRPIVDRLVEQARDNPGALPLVQHALYRFWSRLETARDEAGRQAALDTLADIGPAMARTAEERMRALDEGSRALAWRAFLAGVQLGEGVTDTRRRVPLGEILPADTEEEALRRAIEPFVEDRLLSIGGEAGAPETAWVEISHEALIAHWRDLRTRLTPEAREVLRFSQRAQEAAERWARGREGL